MRSRGLNALAVIALVSFQCVACYGEIALGTGVQVQANTTVEVSYNGGHEATYLLENPTTVLLADVHVFPLLRRYPIEYMLVGFADINSDGLPQVGYDLTFTEPTTPIDVHVTPPPLIPTWVQYLASHNTLGLVACFTNSIQNWYATFPLREYIASNGTVTIQMPYAGAYVVLAGPPSAPQYALFDFAFDAPAVNTTQINFPAGLSVQWTSADAHNSLFHLAATSSHQQQAAVGYLGYRYVTASLLDSTSSDANALVQWSYDPDAVIAAGLEPNNLVLVVYNTSTGLWESVASENDQSGPFIKAALTIPAGSQLEFSLQSTQYSGSSALSAATNVHSVAALFTATAVAVVAALKLAL